MNDLSVAAGRDLGEALVHHGPQFSAVSLNVGPQTRHVTGADSAQANVEPAHERKTRSYPQFACRDSYTPCRPCGVIGACSPTTRSSWLR